MPPEGNPQIFSGATKTTIYGGMFPAVQGDMHIHSPNQERHGMKLLIANISQGAFHNAAERGDPPRCHPHTRSAIRTEIMKWIKAPEAHRKLILWLYGPAGAGKTAIDQSVAEQCEEEGLLAASFFFSRTAAGRNDSSRFVATLAYQLSLSIPEIRESILAAVERDPTIFSRAISVQIRVLVIAPLKSIPLSSRPRAVILDGVDECGPNDDSQVEVLDALGRAAAELRHIPFIFLVGSRPEYAIRLNFNQEPLRSLMHGLFLDNDYQANTDIRLYLNFKFQEIHQKQVILGTKLASTWPSQNDIDSLVDKSSGQFIFAATVMKFIDSPRRRPEDRLDIILGLSDPRNEKPFATLDTLYRFILSAADDFPKVREVLTLLMLAKNYSSKLRVDLVEQLLGFELRRALMDMHALLLIPPPTEPESVLRIHHASLYDFLMDQSRSRDYFIDARQGHVLLSRCWLRLMANYPRFQPDGIILDDYVSHFIFHSSKLPASIELGDYLATFDLGTLLANINEPYGLYGIDWNGFFECAKKQGETRPDIYLRFQDEFAAFLLEKLAQYPLFLQAYIPALFSCRFNNSHSILPVLLESLGQSAAEIEELCRLDQKLLKTGEQLSDPWTRLSPNDDEAPGNTDFLLTSSRIKVRFGRSYLDFDESHAALAKHILRAIWPAHQKKGYRTTLAMSTTNLFFGREPTISVTELLHHSSIDLDLSQILKERTLQHVHSESRDSSEREIIARVSLNYIKKCGVQYLKHAHLPHTNRCIVCEVYSDASSVEDIANISHQDELSPLHSNSHPSTESVPPGLHLDEAPKGPSDHSTRPFVEGPIDIPNDVDNASERSPSPDPAALPAHDVESVLSLPYIAELPRDPKDSSIHSSHDSLALQSSIAAPFVGSDEPPIQNPTAQPNTPPPPASPQSAASAHSESREIIYDAASSLLSSTVEVPQRIEHGPAVDVHAPKNKNQGSKPNASDATPAFGPSPMHTSLPPPSNAQPIRDENATLSLTPPLVGVGGVAAAPTAVPALSHSSPQPTIQSRSMWARLRSKCKCLIC